MYSEVDFLSPQQLENQLRSLVLLDMVAIPKEQDWLRSFSKVPKQAYYRFDNGSGDHFTVIFDETGILIKGFSHENELNTLASDDYDEDFIRAIYQGFPQSVLDHFSDEELEETTFCLWYDQVNSKWIQNHHSENDGGQDWLLSYLFYDAKDWLEWAQEYYECDFDLTLVQEIFDGQPMTDERIRCLSIEADSEAVLAEIRETF